MLGWLWRVITTPIRLLDQGAHDLASLALRGLAAVISYVFRDVTRAWSDFTHVWDAFASVTERWLGGIEAKLRLIIEHWLPRFAITAWWWVTHPDRLAEVLFWWIIRYLEKYAWQAAEHLGEFFTALWLRNLRRTLHLAETILAAVL